MIRKRYENDGRINGKINDKMNEKIYEMMNKTNVKVCLYTFIKLINLMDRVMTTSYEFVMHKIVLTRFYRLFKFL